jgi:flagellar motor component MotA
MKFLGLAICLATIFGAAATVGIHLYFDILSFLFVLGGAVGFLVMKNKPENHLQNFGQGAVYFGWLGTVVGLIAITGTPSFVWGDVEKLGPALAVAMLTVLYGYLLKLVTIALTED